MKCGIFIIGKGWKMEFTGSFSTGEMSSRNFGAKAVRINIFKLRVSTEFSTEVLHLVKDWE